MKTRSQLSIFSQPLDRAAFLAYLLGAVVPLVALGYVAQVYVLPELEAEYALAGLVGLITSVGSLSLGSFLLLRRTAAQSLARMDEDNRRLLATLEASRALSLAPHRTDAARTLAGGARSVTLSLAAYVLIREKEGGDGLSVIGQAGPNAGELYTAQRGPLEELAERALEQGAGAVRSASREGCSLTVVPIHGSKRPLGAIAAVGPAGDAEARARQLDSLATLAAMGAVALHNAELQDMQRNFFVHLTDMLVGALDQHLEHQEGHARRVAHIANRIGRELGFDDERLERLHFGALLHDIGMLKIPADKHADRKVARKHPTLGHRMLVSIRLWEDLAPFVRYHHEWYNGQGYPEGLAGEAIPLESRIIGLAEAVDSMTSATSYKPPVSIEEAVRRVDQSAGTQFDPQVAAAFAALVRKGEIQFGAD